MISRIFRRLSKCLRLLAISFSGLIPFERPRSLRKIRKILLELGGVDIEEGDFFADKGLRVLQPNNFHIKKNVSLGHDNNFWCFSSVTIGAWTQTAKDLLVISGSHKNEDYSPLFGEDQKVEIGAGCWVGARVTILGGTEIGNGCIVAAGAVVKGKFPPFCIIGGVPARVLKRRVPAQTVISPFGEYNIEEIGCV